MSQIDAGPDTSGPTHAGDIRDRLPPSRQRIVIARHGESFWNADGILQGHDGPGLNERGTQQALALGLEVATRFPDIRRIFCSDLERVRATAQHVADTLPDATLVPDLRLREADIGQWSGKTLHEVAQTDPQGLRAWLVGKDIRRGGGETKAEMLARVLDAIGDAVHAARVEALQGSDAAPPPIMVVTHGGPIRLTVAALLGLIPGHYRRIETVLHTSITVLDVDRASASGIAGRLLSYNETSHVAAILGPVNPGMPQVEQVLA